MSKYTKKYKKIVDGLIKKNFPRLKEKKLYFFGFMPYGNFVAMVLDLSFIKLIFLNLKKLKRYNKAQQKAIFVHELCHIERHTNRNLFAKIAYVIQYILFRKMRVKEENETDKLTIKKGYGRELYSFQLKVNEIYSEEILKKIYERGYLSSKQIKSYAKKIGKWSS